MRRTSFAAVLVLCTSVGSLLLAAPASAGVVVVMPGESINQAVRDAEPGDTIQLVPGVYEDVVVVKKDGITIQGAGSGIDGSVLRPPAELPGRCFGGIGGICVFGDQETGTPVQGVTVTGVRAEGFLAAGLIAILTENTTFDANAAFDDGEYGIAAFESDGVIMSNNEVSGNVLAGLYVGDSPRAHATITGNVVHDNGDFGIFLRDARRGELSGNTITGNCLGIVVLDTPSPGRAGNYRILDNTISDNTEVCPGNPSVTGGIGLAGARSVTVEGNTIRGNRPSRAVDLNGGVILIAIDRAVPLDNTVTGNTLVRNRPNVFWDGSGSGNVIEDNDCTPSC